MGEEKRVVMVSDLRRWEPPISKIMVLRPVREER